MLIGIGMNLVRGGTSASPASLFAGGEPGVWYDPSDLTTLFQDSAGTTPVTAPAQTVGLMLDKSQGLVLGSELVSNGNNETVLYSGAGAIAGTIARGAAPGGGFAAVFTCNAGTLSYQALYNTVAANTPIKISVRVYVPTGSLNAIQLFDANDGSWSTATISTKDSWVTITAIRPAKATPWALGIGQTATQALAGQVFYVDDLSVKSLAGNHATQATLAQRPTYGINPITGTRNVMLWTEDFTVSPWAAAVLGASTRTNTTSPYIFGLGLITVSSANGGIRQARSGLTSGQPYTLSFYLESAVANINVVFENGAASFGATHAATIDPSTGAFSSVSGFTSTTSAAFGTGRIYTLVTASAGGTLIANIEWRIPAGSGTLLLGRPQFEIGPTATAYQKVVTQYEVTQAGVQSASYLFFDGVDDGMVTSTITPATDKMQIFAGVRKLSDSAIKYIAEFSATLASNDGSFNLMAPSSSATARYGFTSKGTIASAPFSAGFAAPVTSVVTGLGDIAGDSAILRVNSILKSTITTDQGTGNYLAYPLYIGCRGGSSGPFSGYLYSLITRFGANLTDGQITSTESWVNGETGAY